jgi:hypothetical protein
MKKKMIGKRVEKEERVDKMMIKIKMMKKMMVEEGKEEIKIEMMEKEEEEKVVKMKKKDH